MECADGLCAGPVCGNGILGGFEACDDGNVEDGDGCSATCTVEAGGSCGDGVVQPPEECDDGNAEDGDGCSAMCIGEGGSCGDGVVQPPEPCDDGNLVNDDWCLVGCVLPTCGDGYVVPDDEVEQCDDANSNDDDACMNDCTRNECFGPGCLVVIDGTLLTVYEPTMWDPVGLFLPQGYPQSVAAGPDHRLYLGYDGFVRALDPKTEATVDLGAGLVAGPVTGVTVYDDKVWAVGPNMKWIRMLTLAGADAGTLVAPNGKDLRAPAFGPQGDLYLTGFVSGAIERWAPGLVYVGPFIADGLVGPWGVATRSNGDVLVTAPAQSAYYVFTQAGTFKKKVTVGGCAGGDVRGIAVDGLDRAFVACYEWGSVALHDAADIAVTTIPAQTPAGVAVLKKM